MSKNFFDSIRRELIIAVIIIVLIVLILGILSFFNLNYYIEEEIDNEDSGVIVRTSAPGLIDPNVVIDIWDFRTKEDCEANDGYWTFVNESYAEFNVTEWVCFELPDNPYVEIVEYIDEENDENSEH